MNGLSEYLFTAEIGKPGRVSRSGQLGPRANDYRDRLLDYLQGE